MIDIDGLKKWWDIFVGEGNFTEVRILGKFQYSGYFKSFDNLVKQLAPYTEMDDEQIYFVLNRIDDACYARPQCEKFVKSPKVTTTDSDIIKREWVFIDFDPIRKSSVNASQEEFDFATKKARDVYKFLKEKGFEEPLFCISGNGSHLQYKVDLPNDEPTTEIIKNFYAYLASQFTDEKVDIDRKIFNLARLCKTYGTVAKKGANIQDRPWRKAEIKYVPKEIKTTPIEKFRELADLVPKEEKKQNGVNETNRFFSVNKFDLEGWLNYHNIEYRKKQDGGSAKYEIKNCPWEDTHSTKNPFSSVLYQDTDGKMVYSCAHSHCSDKKWRDFRLFFEPTAYDQKQNEHYSLRRRYGTQKPKYEIKEENDELGKKWLCMKDIKKVDLSDLTFIETGFNQIDILLTGLCLGEVTIISGKNSAGKSSWLNTLMLNAVDKGHKTAIWSGELRPFIMKTWIQMNAAGAEYMKKSNKNDIYYVPTQIADKIDEWLDGKFFLYNNEYSSKWQQIFNDMKLLIEKGVQLFILDNLFSLDIDIFGGDGNEQQRSLVIQICDFAKKNNVHVILVAHPRKATTFLRKEDIKGSGVLSDAVDNIFIIHRVNNDFIKAGGEFFGEAQIKEYSIYSNVIEIVKNRLMGRNDYLCGMYYDTISKRFMNTDTENRKYGWIEEPKQTEIEITESATVTEYITPNTSFYEAEREEQDDNNQWQVGYEDLPY